MPRRRRSFGRPFTSVAEIPLVLYVRDMARLKRRSVFTIWRKLRDGTFHPRPSSTDPYTWLKADILEDLAQLQLGMRRLRRLK